MKAANWIDLKFLKFVELSKPYIAELKLYYYHWGSFPLFLLLNLVKFVVNCFRFLSWRLNGIQAHLDATYHGQNYEISAQILDIVVRCKATPFDKVRSCFFLGVHRNFTHPNCVLADNIMLAEITTDKAVFVELSENIDRYSVRSAKFLFLTLVHDARRLIEIPLVSLHRLASEMGPSTPGSSYERVTFLFGSGRCGSTAVARIVEEADPDGTLVLSEPPVFTDFVSFKRCYSPEFYGTCLRSALKVFLKPMCGKNRLVIKPTYFVCNIAEDVKEYVPSSNFIYCHRDPLKNVLAQKRAFGYSPLYKILQTVFALKIWDYGQTYVGFHRNAKIESVVLRNLKGTLFEICCIVWADCFWRYKEQARKFSFPSLYYDDLLENPELFCSAVLKLVGLDQNRLNAAISSLKLDAQEGTSVSQEFLQDVPCNLPDKIAMSRVDKFCDQLSLPRMNWQAIMHKNQQQNINGFHKTAEHIKNQLNKWEPDNENFRFVKFGRKNLLVQWDGKTQSYVPFSEYYS